MRSLLLGLLLTIAACEGEVDDELSSEGCEEGDYQCDGDLLQVCDSEAAWITEEDCAESDMMCHAPMGHCM